MISKILEREDIGEFIRQLCGLGQWQGISTFYPLSAAVSRPIGTLWPAVTALDNPLYSKIVYGRGVRPNSRAIASSIMFTASAYDGHNFRFDHFVPIIQTQEVGKAIVLKLLK